MSTGEGERDVASKKVVEVQAEAEAKIFVHLEPKEGERLLISLSEEIQPREVFASVTLEDGAWVVGVVSVKGRLYRKDGTLGERWRDRMYSGPLDASFEGPEWLVPLLEGEIASRFGGGVRLTDQQVYDMSMRTKSSVGLENFRKVAEDVLGSKPAVTPEQPKDYARQAFDTALNGLLIRENLEGTQWAIQWLMEKAKELPDRLPESAYAEVVQKLACSLSNELDKRTAELAARGN
jgi:hypothetical protein